MFDTDPTPVIDRLLALANTFPSLAAKNLASLDDIARVATDQFAGTGSRWAACFVLSVTDTHTEGCHQFTTAALRNAWRSWDDRHRAAWQAWAAKPWWA